ncbi:efflux transporter outer membrane subunit [Candidatus Methylospira mobilis]|uniref:efflux transporter outer membrane subunit n=1 Tax=Candidatus Methylospira mobilis TaxID=1808979 RepID=UPI0028ED8F1B|nr:efflux transporter outer membrane subunit [Candidatus Methylospira mobilis]WNV05588.1 efflux transporter outer membrane subunit [Candidatus Methylospira mobilis]
MSHDFVNGSMPGRPSGQYRPASPIVGWERERAHGKHLHDRLGCLLVALLLGGCAVGPDFEKPVARSPQKWSELPANTVLAQSELPSKTIQASPDREWWRQFNDPVLSSLVERALQGNMTLRTASALLAQSRAQRGIAGADQFPMLNGNASYTRFKPSQDGILSLSKTLTGTGGATSANGTGMSTSANGTGVGAIGIPAAGIQPFNLYQYGFDASWEVDLWGRVRRELESAEAGVEVSREEHHDAQLSVIAEVARNYIELRRLQGRREIARQRRDVAQEQLDLIGQQAARGVVTDIEVETAKAGLSNVLAELPQLDQQVEQAVNQLSLLLGRQPGTLTGELSAARPVPAIPARVRIGLPSELAQRRPDIREAEARLHGALADIGMATAEFYPRFTLSGSAGLQALNYRNLGNWAALQYAMGPTVTLPLFQGGRLVSTLELRQEEHRQAAIGYQNTVLSAWHEIDNSLSAYNESQRRQLALQASVHSNAQALTLGQQRYRQGVANFLPVLQARATLLQAEQAEIDGAGVMATNIVALYKALGGGWQVAQEQEVAENEADGDKAGNR